MTLIKPQLSIERVIVTKGGIPVYDEKFHPRLNIIYGHNSSGKSTIIDLIYYGLGGTIVEWKTEALSCDTVYIQTSLNHATTTIRRDITSNKMQHIDISFNTYEAAYKAPETWKRFQYSRSEHKDSFSQIFLKMLDFPECKGDTASIITTHQILRLLFKDQLTSVDRIFKFDYFDSPLKRDTIANLLLGVYDFELYELQLMLDEKKKKLTALNSQIKAYHRILAKFGKDYSPSVIDEKISLIQDKIAKDRDQALIIQKQSSSKKIIKNTRPEKNELRDKILSIKKQLSDLSTKQEDLEANISDSHLFIKILQQRLEEIDDSNATSKILGTSQIQFCPLCYSKLNHTEINSCKLCGNELSPETIQSNLLKMKTEIRMQLSESQELIRETINKYDDITQQIEAKKLELNTAIEGFSFIHNNAITIQDQKLLEISGSIGYHSRELEDLKERRSVLSRFENIYKEREELQTSVSEIEALVSDKIQTQSAKKAIADKKLSTILASLLKLDLKREPDFIDPKTVSINFENDRTTINGKSYFSASSMAILRTMVFLSIFKYSIDEQNARAPRFIIIDSIEDKGMEPARYHNVQNIIQEMSLRTEIDHQIILTTSDLSDKIDIDKTIVGIKYTEQRRTLAI